MPGFVFCEARYSRAVEITVKIVDFIRSDFDRKCFEHAIECGDEPTLEGWSAALDALGGSDFKDLCVMLTPELKVGQAQYMPTDQFTVIAIPFKATRKAGKTTLPEKTIWRLFHEVVHHIDYIDGLEFETDIVVGDLDNEDLFRRYFNTPHEQRAYFYEGVFRMRSAKDEALPIKKIKGRYFPDFYEPDLSAENFIVFNAQIDQAVNCR